MGGFYEGVEFPLFLGWWFVERDVVEGWADLDEVHEHARGHHMVLLLRRQL
jgi:hypothetical protein